MKKRLCITCIIAVLCTLAAACQDDTEKRSFISKFRILGIQATPPEAVTGDNIEVRGIFAPKPGHDANVAFVTLDTGWIAELDNLLPENVDQYSAAELQTLLESLLAENSVDNIAASDLLVPRFKVMTAPVDPGSGLAVLPSENIIISRALVAIMKLLGQTNGIPLYLLACSNGVIDETALLEGTQTLSSSQEIGDLETACHGNNATAIAAFKTLNISIPDAITNGLTTDDLNANPQINLLQIEDVIHSPNSPPGETGTMVCEGTDGCRDPFTFRVAVFKKDFQYFEGFSRRENEMEKMFVSWFSNGGEMSSSRIRSNDAQTAADAMADGDIARMDELLAANSNYNWFTVDWLPPIKGGTFDLWVVVNDLRGGVGYARYRIKADAGNY